MKWIMITLGITRFILLLPVAKRNKLEDNQSLTLYLDMEGNMHGWDYKALINSYSFIRLTNDEKSENGYVFTKTPFEAKNWFVEFQFEIGSAHRFPGDGMAFWYTEKPFQPGEAFGHDEKFKGLGVFFDTFRNGDHEVTNNDERSCYKTDSCCSIISLI